jgi:hypothetical protein
LRPALLVLGVPAATCAGWTILAGKDLNWDLLNYHYYAPFHLLAGRLQQDYFAASAQSYLNPLGYLPFYGMVAAGWHSVLASVLLAIAHSLSIAALYLIAWRLFAHLPRRERIVLCSFAAALGASSAVFWATVGTSFLDPLLAPLVLFGLLLLMDGRRFALAGVLFGAAAALKYSNAIYALAALPLVVRSGFLRYAAGGLAALAVLAGPWLALMWREFGNPLYPMGAVSLRFTPGDLADALLFPFRMLALDRGLYAEIFAPDLRFAALALAAVFVRKGVDWRLFGFFGLGYVLWLATSANARYGLVLLLLAGVCLAQLLERVLPLRAARVVLGVLLVLQLVMAAVAAPARWFIAEPWSRHWFPYQAPERALREPALYLTLETLPMAVVAPFVHPESSFANVRGQVSIPADEPRLVALIERHRGRARVLGRSLDWTEGTLARLGFRLDRGECFTIDWRPDAADALSRAANWLARTPPSGEPLSLVSCALRPAPRDPGDSAKERAVGALFDRIEQACPRLFRGQSALAEPFGSGWVRHYVGLDARLEAIGGKVVLNRYRAGVDVDLGRLEDWERGEVAPACR